ncbi:hypothetical protein BLNAU_12410 [Blattamonas nauphoetae]|uniref:Uncharacterized protein n=1 Tax=Blattamonas nauphoetae TaxID=2049346 RepID=A0ABQ9XJH4_9EUKA|nr:hypothetical protein BLNAU_12410 [Blattamonas nauphoetae]
MTRGNRLSRMTPTHFCGLSSDVGNAMIAGADEQLTVICVFTLVPGTEPQTTLRNRRIQTTPDDSVGNHGVSSAWSIVRDGTTCDAAGWIVNDRKRRNGKTHEALNSITPTLLQSNSLLNTVVALFISPSKQLSDEVPTEFFQNQHFKNRMDKVDEVHWKLANETLFSTAPSHFIRLFSQHEAHRPKQPTKGKHRLRRCSRHTHTSQTQTSL